MRVKRGGDPVNKMWRVRGGDTVYRVKGVGGPGSNVEEGEDLAKKRAATVEGCGWNIRVGWVPGECAAGRSQTPRGWSSCQVGISAQKGMLICMLPPKRQGR